MMSHPLLHQGQEEAEAKDQQLVRKGRARLGELTLPLGAKKTRERRQEPVLLQQLGSVEL